MLKEIILMGQSIFDSEMQTLVNPVNCVGIMGKGLALEFRINFPDMHDEYTKMCRKDLVRVGEPYICKLQTPWVLNFPTKRHWKTGSDMDFITDGIELFTKNYKSWGIESIAFPAIGCGNGGLPWRKVIPILEEMAEKVDIPVEIYAPIAGRGNRTG